MLREKERIEKRKRTLPLGPTVRMVSAVNDDVLNWAKIAELFIVRVETIIRRSFSPKGRG